MNGLLRRFGVAVGASTLVIVGVTGCSVSVGGPSYSQSKMETKIRETQVKAVGSYKLGKASCPEKVELKEGVTFKCTLEIGDVKAPYQVVLTKVESNKPHFSIAPAKAIIKVQQAEEFVKKNLTAPNADQATVVCGDGTETLILADPGDRITCKATLGEQSGAFHLKVKDTKGSVTLEQ